jgi:3-dehydroquinate synthase
MQRTLLTPQTLSTVFTIGALLKDESNSFWAIHVRKGLEEAIRQYPHLRLHCLSPQHGLDFSTQQKMGEQLVRENVNVLILAPAHPTKLASVVKKANKKGIPVIIIDSRLDEKEIARHKLKYTFIGFDDYSGGYQTGKLFCQKLRKGSPIGIIQGHSHGSYVRRVKGFRDAIGSRLKIKKIVSAEFDENKAHEKTREILGKYSKIQAIFCTSDNMAMGCLTALYELNRPNILVSGFDATHAGKLAVQKGRLLSTVDSNPEEMGRMAIRTAQKLIFTLIHPSNLEYSVELLQTIPENKFLKPFIRNRKYRILTPIPTLAEFDYQGSGESLICPILLGKNLFVDIPLRLKEMKADQYIIVTDTHVQSVYGNKLLDTLRGAGLRVNIVSFPEGERTKTFTTLNEMANRVLDLKITKRSCLVVLGGGVVGNVAGFLASILMRGIRFVHIPTTVTSQVDSTTGGKQAVNTTHGKNLLGTFYEPEFIYIDTTLVQTLPKREYQSGMAEAIKHGFCGSQDLLSLIAEGVYEKIVEETIRLKIKLVEKDPLEQKEGSVLLYGHTIGHTLETISHHQLTHGEAVSIGMVAAARISHKMEFASLELITQHEKILSQQKLPIRIPSIIPLSEVMRALTYDKKERTNLTPFVLLEKIGKVKTLKGSYLIEVNPDIILQVLEEMKE